MRWLIPVLLVGLGSPVAAQSFPFVEDTTSALVSGGARGWLGAYWADFDNDLDLDLLVTDAHRSDRLFVNEGDGVFESVALTVSPYREVNGGGWIDVDRDRDLDFVAASIAGSAMLLNPGTGLPPFEWVPLAFDGDAARDIAAADYDRDGDPDLALVAWHGGLNLLYRNAGFGFSLGQSLSSGVDGTTACWGDFDGDGWADLYGVNASGDASVLYRNEDGVLAVVEGSAANELGHSQGCGWADYDSDGDLDLYVARGGITGQADRLYRNDDGVLVSILDVPMASDSGGTFGSAWGDVDNDGDLDLATVNRDGLDVLYINTGETFEATQFGAASDGWSLAATLVDDDEDGDLDLFTTHGSYAELSRNRLYRNTTDSTGRSWLALDLRGEESDRFGLGARAIAYATIAGQPRQLLREVVGRSGRMAQDGFRLHFGLGDASVVDSLTIIWPWRGAITYYEVPINQVRVYGEEHIAVPTSPVAERQDATLSILPNPSDGAFDIVVSGISAGTAQVDFFDLMGRHVGEIEQHTLESRIRAAWSGIRLAPGHYVARLRGSGVASRFVIR